MSAIEQVTKSIKNYLENEMGFDSMECYFVVKDLEKEYLEESITNINKDIDMQEADSLVPQETEEGDEEEDLEEEEDKEEEPRKPVQVEEKPFVEPVKKLKPLAVVEANNELDDDDWDDDEEEEKPKKKK